MVNYQPICLQVSCSNIITTTSNTYTVTLTADGGQETAYYQGAPSENSYKIKTYTCYDITIGMYFSNRTGCIWQIQQVISKPSAPSNYTQARVILLDINGYNSLLDTSDGYSSGAPLEGVLGYIYTVNNGLPLLNDVINPPSPSWATSLITRHFMYFTASGSGSGSVYGTK